MSNPSVQTTVPKALPSPQATLAQLVAVAEKQVGEQLSSMAQRMVAALLDVTGAGASPDEVRLCIKSGNLLRDNSYAFIHLASTELGRALNKEIDQLTPSSIGAHSVSAAALSLVPMEEMDTRVAFGAITRPFDIAHSEQLATLGVRLGMLLGRQMLRSQQNPFRPEVILVALHDAWRQFEPDSAAHGLLLPLLRPGVVFDMAPLLEALNQALLTSGQAGGARFQKSDGAAAARAARAGREAALAQQLKKLFGADTNAGNIDDTIPLIPDLPHLPQGQGGWRPSGAAGFGAVAAMPAVAATGSAPVAAPPGGAHAAFGTSDPAASALVANAAGAAAGGAPLMELLGKLQLDAAASPGHADIMDPGRARQVFFLPRLKQSLPQGSLSRSDESTLDLLSRIFETVFLDDSISEETRELIQSLQIPVLKAALRDKNFFFEEAHPARRMVDLVSNIGADQRGGRGDPLFEAMRRSIDRVGRNTEGQPEAFAQAVAELEASVGAAQRAAEAAMAEPIANALRQERQATARHSARQAVAMRLGEGEVVAVISAFLENKWTSVLTLAYTIEDDKPGAVENATRTMDDLIWSVKPKATQEQRKALIARLPGLLTTLNKWLDAIKWIDAERLQFFARLAECHASIVRAPIDASPVRQLELAVEAAQQDALRRVAQENALAAQEQPDKDEAELAVDELERGMRLEFTQADGARRKLKLAWVSPLRSLFIFSGAARAEGFSMPAEKLVAALRAGKVSIAPAEGVVGRVLSQALGVDNDGELSAQAA